MSDENDGPVDETVEAIIVQGDLVFSHDWDSGGPGAGAGSEEVYLWNGQFASASLDFGNQGPFETLDEALEESELLSVSDATTKIKSSIYSDAEIAGRLKCDIDGQEILINETKWTFREKTGKFDPSV